MVAENLQLTLRSGLLVHQRNEWRSFVLVTHRSFQQVIPLGDDWGHWPPPLDRVPVTLGEGKHDVLNISLRQVVVCPAEGRELTRHSAGNSSFCQTHTLKVLTPTSTYRQFIILYVLFVKISYQARFCLQISYHASLLTILIGYVIKLW